MAITATQLGWSLAVLIGIGLFLLGFYWFRASAPAQEALPYAPQTLLFTPAESRFLGVLDQVLDRRFLIFGKVRLADVIKPTPGLNGSAYFSAFNRIACKHLDFVICHAHNQTIIGAIELDDSSHNRPDRQARDRFVDGALAAAGVPILHVKVQRHYAPEHLKAELMTVLGLATMPVNAL